MGESAELFRRELSGLYDAAGLRLKLIIIQARKQDPATKLNLSSLSDWKNGKSVPSARGERRRRDFELLINVLNRHARSGYVMHDPAWWERLRAAADKERNSTRGTRVRAETSQSGDARKAPTATAALGRSIREWNPLDLEVKPTAIGPARDPDRMLPGYVRRAFDLQLAEVVERAAAGTSEMVVLVGNSSTGKTRACWEAVQPLSDLGWRLWHPHHSLSAPVALAALEDVAPRTVLWLNEAQQYLDAGQNWALKLNALLADSERAPVLILGTLWSHHDDRYSAKVEAGELDLHLRTRELLSGRRITIPDEFDRTALIEAQRMAAAGDRLLAEVLRRRHDGRIAQLLGGSPELMRSYTRATAIAKSLLHAAMDACRLGVGLVIPVGLLAQAAPDYLHVEDEHKLVGDWLSNGLAEVGEPVHGDLAPLRRSPRAVSVSGGEQNPACYRLADVLEEHGRKERSGLMVPRSLWQGALEHVNEPAALLALGRSAQERFIYSYAQQFYARARLAGSTEAAELESRLLAARHLLDELRRRAVGGDLSAHRALARAVRDQNPAAAEAVYHRAIDAGCVDLCGELGALLLGNGDVDGAAVFLRTAYALQPQLVTGETLITALIACGRVDQARDVAADYAVTDDSGYAYSRVLWHLVMRLVESGNEPIAADVVRDHLDVPRFPPRSLGDLVHQSRWEFLELMAGLGVDAARYELDVRRAQTAGEADLDELAELAGRPGGIARSRRAALLAAAGDEPRLRSLVEQGDRSAVAPLADVMVARGATSEAIDLLRPHAGLGELGPPGVTSRLIDLLVEQGRDGEFELLITTGRGGRTLADWLYERKRLDDLIRLHRSGTDISGYMPRRIARLQSELGRGLDLKVYAQRSSAAAMQLQEHRLEQGRADEVYGDAVAGDGFARRVLEYELESSHPRIPIEELRRCGLTPEGALAL